VDAPVRRGPRRSDGSIRACAASVARSPTGGRNRGPSPVVTLSASAERNRLARGHRRAPAPYAVASAATGEGITQRGQSTPPRCSTRRTRVSRTTTPDHEGRVSLCGDVEPAAASSRPTSQSFAGREQVGRDRRRAVRLRDAAAASVIEALIGRIPRRLPATLPGYRPLPSQRRGRSAIAIGPAAQVDGLVYRDLDHRELTTSTRSRAASTRAVSSTQRPVPMRS
jgi:hypothetical protein